RNILNSFWNWIGGSGSFGELDGESTELFATQPSLTSPESLAARSNHININFRPSENCLGLVCVCSIDVLVDKRAAKYVGAPVVEAHLFGVEKIWLWL